jgi:hypothetical protein
MRPADPRRLGYMIQIIDAALEVITPHPSIAALLSQMYPAQATWWCRPARTMRSLYINRLPLGGGIDRYSAQSCGGSDGYNFLVSGRPSLASKLDWLISDFAVRELSRHHFLLHGAALAAGGSALLVIGTSGAGKSTLAAALALSGYWYLSDEIAVLDGVSLRVWPFPKSVSLRRGGWQALDELYPGWCHELVRDPLIPSEGGVLLSPQQWLPPAPGDGFEPVWIFFTRYEPGRQDSQVTPLSRGDALGRLLRQRLSAHRWQGFGAFTAAMIELVKRTPCYLLEAGSLRSAVACIDRLLGDARRESSFVHTDRVPVPVHEPLRAP